MQKLLFLCLSFLLTVGLAAQDPIYVNEFDGDTPPFNNEGGFTFTQGDGLLTVSGDGSSGAFGGFWLGLGGNLDITAAPQVYLRANASDFGTQVRVDLVDVDGNFSNQEPITVTLSSDMTTYTLDFSTVATTTNEGTPLDLTQIQALYFYVDPGLGGFSGQIQMDFVSIGAEIDGEIMSDIYQDDMETDSSFASFVFAAEGYSTRRGVDENGDSTVVTIVGDGTAVNPYSVTVYRLRPAPEYIETSVDISDNPKLYIRARGSRNGIILRTDIEDGDALYNNGSATGRELADTFKVLEYDYANSVGFPVPGTACTEENLPCIVNLEDVIGLVFYIDPGTAGFAGEVDIDWVSFGVNLEGEGEEAPLLYAENFSNNRVDFVGPVAGYTVAEEGTNLTITGDGSGGAYSTVSYTFHDPVDSQDTLVTPTTVDFAAGGNKLFVRARTNGPDALVRIDVIDTTGALTDFSSARQTFTSDWQTFTYDYEGRYIFADYGEGNDSCDPENRCPVDATAIGDLLFFIDETTGGFNGEIEIDWLSVGQPLEAIEETEPGVINYSDDLAGSDGVWGGTYNGVTVSVVDGVANITSNGMTDDYHQVRYTLRDEDGNSGKADVIGSNNLLYMSARVLNTANDTARIRVDLRDEAGFETSNTGVFRTITGTEFMTYEFDYSGRYLASDGGYGGTSCTSATAPCDVDGQRVTGLVIYPEPAEPDLVGTIEIDWISFGEPLMVSVRDFAELDLLRAFPNPATNQLAVEFELVDAGDVTLTLFDALGRRQLVRQLGTLNAGRTLEPLDLSNLATGTYHLQVMVNGKPTRALTVLKH